MSEIKKTIVTAMLIALCVVLPIAFHAIPGAGSTILPMHIPVLLAGLIAGWKYGLIAGVAGPLLSSITRGMPPMPIAQLMSIELGVYGLVAGIMIYFVRTNRSSVDLYISLITAMVVGRIVAGFAQFAFFFQGTYHNGVWTYTYPMGIWVTSYFVTSLPGIVIQLILIPSVFMALERERFMPFRYPIEPINETTEAAIA